MASGLDTILYEAPHRIIKLFEEIAAIDAKREVFAAKELTKRHQNYYRMEAEALLELLRRENTKGEWAVVIAGKSQEEQTLSYQELLQIDMPPKPKAKLMAKLSGKSVKECYESLQKKR